MDVELGNFISQKNEIKSKYNYLCDKVFDYLSVNTESDITNFDTPSESFEIKDEKNNNQIDNIKNELKSKIESLSREYKKYINNIKEKLSNIEKKLNLYSEQFVNYKDDTFNLEIDINIQQNYEAKMLDSFLGKLLGQVSIKLIMKNILIEKKKNIKVKIILI